MNQEYVKENDFYKTDFLPLVCSLILNGYKLDCIDQTRSSDKASFVFARENEIDAFVESFWRHEVLVEPISFFNQIKEAKEQISK